MSEGHLQVRRPATISSLPDLCCVWSSQLEQVSGNETVKNRRWAVSERGLKGCLQLCSGWERLLWKACLQPCETQLDRSLCQCTGVASGEQAHRASGLC